MSTPKKDYFVIFDKDRKEQKDFVFNVSFFYLKDLKKGIKKSISFVSTPFFTGSVLFGKDFKDKMRPLRLEKITRDGKTQPVNPKILRKFIFNDSAKFIAFSDQASEEEISPVKEMLKNFQYDNSKIQTLSICASCIENNQQFTIMREKQRIKSFKNDYICSKCALEEVLKQSKLKGAIPQEKISPKLKNFFNHMILKFRNVRKVLSLFESDFDPLKDRQLTLYDVEETTPVAEKYKNITVNNLIIPKSFKNALKNQKIFKLLPIQAISIDQGLLTERVDQLIMAPTSGGKTLIGELCGISKLLEDRTKKMLYLVPIVALANVRTEEFKHKYSKSLDLKVVKKVGESIFEKSEDISKEDIMNADIIVGTYEAIDYVLRSGSKDDFFREFSTIIIDEVQTLIDDERGYFLDGFIARLKSIYTNSQFLYLSATIGEPKSLAKKLNCKLIQYNNRPVPVERHLIMCLNETFKNKMILRLTKAAYFEKSKFGFKGQTIIFTNTRKKCEALSGYLQENNLRVEAYHSGLTNEERKKIEIKFQKQHIAGVVSTAALAAGVDFPAKQVIFESLSMGIKWLTVAEFEQMLGRAGRLKKHEKGVAYLLVEPGKIYTPKMKETEENIAIKLLNGKIKDFELVPEEDRFLTELLAFISMHEMSVNQHSIDLYHQYLVNDQYKPIELLRKLRSSNLIRFKEDSTYKIQPLGKAIAKSFLTVEKGLEIIQILEKKESSLIDIILELKPLRNVFLSKKVVADLTRVYNKRYTSNNLFSASVLSLFSADSIKHHRGNFSREYIRFFSDLTKEIFNCSCSNHPYCDCARINLERILLSLRVDEEGFSIERIQDYLEEKYKIIIFKGDLIDFFENLIYSFESIKDIAQGVKNLDSSYDNEIKTIPELIKKIRG